MFTAGSRGTWALVMTVTYAQTPPSGHGRLDSPLQGHRGLGRTPSRPNGAPDVGSSLAAIGSIDLGAWSDLSAGRTERRTAPLTLAVAGPASVPNCWVTRVPDEQTPRLDLANRFKRATP